MISKVGYRWTVELKVTSGHWYPSRGGTKEKASMFHSDLKFDMVCNNPGIAPFRAMLETLLAQEYGQLGVHNGRGAAWDYTIKIIKYKGKVWLPMVDG